jgi:hypothetical protein
MLAVSLRFCIGGSSPRPSVSRVRCSAYPVSPTQFPSNFTVMLLLVAARRCSSLLFAALRCMRVRRYGLCMALMGSTGRNDWCTRVHYIILGSLPSTVEQDASLLAPRVWVGGGRQFGDKLIPAKHQSTRWRGSEVAYQYQSSPAAFGACESLPAVSNLRTVLLLKREPIFITRRVCLAELPKQATYCMLPQVGDCEPNESRISCNESRREINSIFFAPSQTNNTASWSFRTSLTTSL